MAAMWRGILMAVNWLTIGYLLKGEDKPTEPPTFASYIWAVVYLLTLIAVVYLIIKLIYKLKNKKRYAR